MQTKPAGGGCVEGDGLVAGVHILAKLICNHGATSGRPAPAFLEPRKAQQPEVSVRSIGGGRGGS